MIHALNIGLPNGIELGQAARELSFIGLGILVIIAGTWFVWYRLSKVLAPIEFTRNIN